MLKKPNQNLIEDCTTGTAAGKERIDFGKMGSFHQQHLTALCIYGVREEM